MTLTSDYGAQRACLKGLGASRPKGHKPNYYSVLYMPCLSCSPYLVALTSLGKRHKSHSSSAYGYVQIASSAPYSRTPCISGTNLHIQTKQVSLNTTTKLFFHKMRRISSLAEKLSASQ